MTTVADLESSSVIKQSYEKEKNRLNRTVASFVTLLRGSMVHANDKAAHSKKLVVQSGRKTVGRGSAAVVGRGVYAEFLKLEFPQLVPYLFECYGTCQTID